MPRAAGSAPVSVPNSRSAYPDRGTRATALTQVGHRRGLIAFVLVKSQAFPALLVLGHDDPGAWLT
jgi:hypothetical protein